MLCSQRLLLARPPSPHPLIMSCALELFRSLLGLACCLRMLCTILRMLPTWIVNCSAAAPMLYWALLLGESAQGTLIRPASTTGHRPTFKPQPALEVLDNPPPRLPSPATGATLSNMLCQAFLCCELCGVTNNARCQTQAVVVSCCWVTWKTAENKKGNATGSKQQSALGGGGCAKT